MSNMTNRMRKNLIKTINESIMEYGIDEVMETVSAALYEYQEYAEGVGDDEQAGEAESFRHAIDDVLSKEDRTDDEEEDTGILGGDDE